jgi:AcrR family transcriptional regulator
MSRNKWAPRSAYDEKASARQTQILDDLERIILAEGFAHLQLSDLTRRLHCSRATLYALAPSKEALMGRVFDRIALEWIAYARQQAAKRPPGVERIVRYAESIARRQAKVVPQLWRDAQTMESTRAVMVERSAISGRDYVGYLEEARRMGLIRGLNPTYIASVILAGARNTRDPDILAEAGITADEAMRELARFLRSGVGASD